MLEKRVFAIWWQKMFQHQEDRLAERMVSGCPRGGAWDRQDLFSLPVIRIHELGGIRGICFLSVEFTHGSGPRQLLNICLFFLGHYAWPVVLLPDPFCSLPATLPQAILHAERQLLQRAWFTWHQRAAACCQERQRQAAACAHHRLGQLRKAFCIWRERARGLRAE